MVKNERARDWAIWRSRLRALSARQVPADWVEAYEAELASLPERTVLMHHQDPEYPAALKDLPKPPEFLYWQGPLILSQSIGMIGTRDPDHEGVRIARRFAAEIAQAGACVVSGGARGIDAACHLGAIEAGGTTIVVLPSALDRPSPHSNASLFGAVVQNGGALVSEYPLLTPVRKHFFARRNSLIAALSEQLVVVRARATGGSHLTVEAARQLGRPIFAVPGSPDDPSSAGCLALIRQGETCAWAVDHLGLTRQMRANRLEPDVQRVYDKMNKQCGCTFDELTADLEMSTSAITRALLELELSGLMVKHGPTMHALAD